LAGRPKRDRAVLRELIQHEFWWAVIFARIRYGQRGGDDSIPDLKEAALKWRYLPNSKLWLNTSSKRLFSAKDLAEHAKELDEDFTQNVVRARPRDLPNEPEVWKALTGLHTKPAEVRRICKQSQYLTRFYLNVLLSHAKEFCNSKCNKRYPCAGLTKGSKPRPSSEDKRADYFARVMAGLSLRKPLAPATAVDLLRKMNHGRRCVCWRCQVRRSGRTGRTC
jgi:hypothetical protein